MKILVAPTGFKESLEAHAAADCIEAGILRVVPHAEIRKVPLFDGGEGFAHALVTATGGKHREVAVTGPVAKPVRAYYGFLGGGGTKTAVLDMAAAAGLQLVPKNMRDPTMTTTYGVGELILAALNDGAQRVIVGCGDSGTSDGGVGMCQALGVRFLDCEGCELPLAAGGGTLSDLSDIDFSNIHTRVKEVNIDVLCNWKNVLCGPAGVALVYGPQKGSNKDQVKTLAAAFDTYAAVVNRKIGIDVSLKPGSGASGGLGAGFMLLGARLRPRFEAITEYFGIDDLFNNCNLVFTAEGGIDYQTPRGKIPAELAMRAKKRGLPVIALAGTVGVDAHVNYDAGIDAFSSIVPGPTTLENAILHAQEYLTDAAESTMRTVIIGQTIRDTNNGYVPGPLSQEKDPISRQSFSGGGELAKMIPRFALFLLAFCSFILYFPLSAL